MVEHDVQPVGPGAGPVERGLPAAGRGVPSLDQVRRARAELVERGRWGEADEIVREVVEVVLAGGAPADQSGTHLDGLVYLPGGPAPDTAPRGGIPEEQRLAVRAVQLANRGTDRARTLATARRLLALPGWRGAGAFWCGVLVLGYGGRLDEARERCARALRDTGAPGARGVVALLAARLTWSAGDPAGAARELSQSVRREVGEQVRGVAVAWLVAALVDLGELDRAHDLLLEHDFGGGLTGVRDRAELFLARGGLHVARGRLDRALEDYLDCGRELARWGVSNPAVAPWRSRAAVCANALNRTDLARALVSKELAAARRWGNPRLIGLVSHAAAVVAGSDPEALRAAATALEGDHALGESLYARYDLALALGTRDRYAEARETLEQVRDTARRTGYRLCADRAEAALTRMTTLDGAGGLTRQERKIGELARTGRSNREIAEEQYLTVRTVEFHLSRVYRKLGIAGRRDLRTILTPLT
ncbi:LuxR C-terminal-related transcriptional regulator [Actinosynnema sp. NPDC047251]|uniref:Transcriptional regulator n=1 Tax=Saccharothrix espanaensis (strain ATCC 51144 / DSM 44229 / JCM 9112 / NBRC 15066 / NRRL 15764) TaxID=1179773 RepID=K0K3C8_SACES|nr:LuxR C-terminal-related transcriptional regulator [Saccharothrix espanaensis]CCH31394.1 Transcriptional regulator [Saccharothrix espanaensis DSM 44229]